jgi:hypothetical protein
MKQEPKTLSLSRRGFLARLSGVVVTLSSGSLLAEAFSKPAPWDSKLEARINVEVATIEGFRVHRPYVAVWIEDASGKSIRTVSLWVQTQRRGPKWIPDLRRWFRGEQNRQQTDGGDLVQTVSAATRGAGKYAVSWDGKTDKGKPVTQGDYYVCIEAAREHGTYQLIREKVTFGNKPFKKEFAGNEEIAGASVELAKKA